MSETNTTTIPTTPANTPAEDQPGTSPLPLNEAQLASLTKTEEICRVALLPEYLAPLTALDDGEAATEDHITEAGINAILDLCAQARGKGGSAAAATSNKQKMSKAEAAAQAALLDVIHFIQARARQKHHAASPATLRDYGIGENIDASRTILEGFAQAIYDKTAADPLPRVTPARRKELKDALDAYKKAQTDQLTASSAAGDLRIDRNQLVKATTAGRMKIQFAADAEWPFTDPASHPTRRLFQLPASRAFVG